MNIKILDSWLREYLKTNATPQQIAEKLSLASISIERIEKYKKDLVYDIEVTTNRPDLMSVIGLAREAATVLPQFGIDAHFLSKPVGAPIAVTQTHNLPLTIINNPKLVNRVCAAVLEVKLKPTPQHIKDRLEASDIRSLNNLIDITSYVMRVTGHPTHVMDYDRIKSHTIRIRESQKGEKITTLDNKTYTLPGGDIVADDGKGTIIDLLGIMGVENSVVTDETKRIIFLIDNNDPNRMRRTSMTTAIRTEAVTINEKGIDPQLVQEALFYGIQLYQELADGKILSDIIDIYPNKPTTKTINISEQKINQTIGIKIPIQTSQQILQSLGFNVEIIPSTNPSLSFLRRQESSSTLAKKEGASLTIIPPSWRNNDIVIPEDIIEEIARIYGYHNIPNALPEFQSATPVNIEQNEFYWEQRIKNAFKYWGFTETYTIPMVSAKMFQSPIENAVTIKNPLTEDMTHMRGSIIPSLIQVAKENNREEIKIFEIGNTYKQTSNLPDQIHHLSALIKKPNLTFFEIKGLIEQLATDLGIPSLNFQLEKNNMTVKVSTPLSFLRRQESRSTNDGSKDQPTPKKENPEPLGQIQLLSDNTIAFELNLQTLLKHATLKKIYTPTSKFPPVIEDLALLAPQEIKTADIITTIQNQTSLIKQVTLLDRYQDTRTFHIIYQSQEKNLTTEEIGGIRTKILSTLKSKLNITQP